MAAVALTACGASANGSARSKASDSGSATARAAPVLKVASVREAIRAAAGAAGLGHLRFTDITNVPLGGGSCSVMAMIRTETKPARRTVEAFVATFKKRGWRATDEMPVPSGVGFAVEKDGWSLVVLAGELSKEQVAKASPDLPSDEVKPFRGVAISGIGKHCGAPKPTAP
ncbi:hypothetical protein [Streptomyces sp. NPDC096934]|uniref:hypothetical protein n=1 Tax=Streptomyces sp. NPDC096934 TaxID=3155551 RepID=UPI003324F393